ncbi:Formiminoglutamic iminohydrolase [Fulvivirga imtechensis AK7]|uniref:Formiminoglutamic iminohydrolase n=1 Tax=Fulvivirga imtechensis AK7 TaxID=1237149 RepID=L8JU20_9BACT|nr:formimidoylglutamate deiminase [Fulvivirga imtechensis]ELR71049.1 Formiminoglutamic iminohydrolase [Fulvivirga imtechensis AK7]
MKSYKFKALLQQEGWIDNAVVTIDNSGIIKEISAGTAGEAEVVNGFAMPGFQNAHSHAFQYAMAGIAERHENHEAADDFWTWREAMYQLALTMEPEDIEHVATMLYAEMVRHGYTHVAEFHYLHHDKNGQPYNNLAEHGERLIAAAANAGIKITLVPMFYQKGGFGMDPQPRQRRFISPTIADYFRLLEASHNATRAYEGASLGYGIHSLRAVQPSDINTTIKEGPKNIPFHIHIAEQLKEIEDAKIYLKQRPVEWLLNNTEVTDHFHLVHATHLTKEEIHGIARSGANVVLCPSTEGNLGDGIFPLKEFQKKGGRWSIGTDSHVGLNPLEELRILDYGQRLTSHQRNTFVASGEPDSGAYGYKQALLAGRKAMGNENTYYFEAGKPFDAVVYNAEAALLASSSAENRLSSIVYAADVAMTLGTIINGKWKVKNNIHSDHRDIVNNFVQCVAKLKIR